jgi:hypothetical protein
VPCCVLRQPSLARLPDGAAPELRMVHGTDGHGSPRRGFVRVHPPPPPPAAVSNGGVRVSNDYRPSSALRQPHQFLSTSTTDVGSTATTPSRYPSLRTTWYPDIPHTKSARGGSQPWHAGDGPVARRPTSTPSNTHTKVNTGPRSTQLPHRHSTQSHDKHRPRPPVCLSDDATTQRHSGSPQLQKTGGTCHDGDYDAKHKHEPPVVLNWT